MATDYIDIDQVCEVPDTPDRVASDESRNIAHIDIETDSSVSAHSRKSHVHGEGPHNRARGKSKLIIDDGLNKRLSFDPVSGPIISKESVAILPTSRNGNIFRKTMIRSRREEKGKSPLTSSSSPKRENAVVDLTKSTSPPQILEMAFPKESRNSIVASSTNKGKEKIDVKGANVIPPPRARGLKRLVKNGCISPHNIAKSKHVAENNSNGSRDVRKDVGSLVSDSSLDLMRELVSEDNNLLRGKRLNSNLSLPKDADTKNMPSRKNIAHSKNASETSTSVRGALSSFDGIGGWRNTHTLKADPSFSLNDTNVNHQNERTAVRRFNRVGSSPSSRTLIKRHKHGSSSNNHGESSSFPSINKDVVVLGSPETAPNLVSRRNMDNPGVGTSSSFIEIDEFSPCIRTGVTTNRACSNGDDIYAKAMQLEADEMLALELQEQMYNEMSQVRNREIDAHIALALQEEETSQQASASTSPPVFYPRGRELSNSNRRSQPRSSQNPLTRSTTRARGSNSSRLTRLRREVANRSPRVPVSQRSSSVFPSNMDLDTRLHILEALEAFSDMGVASNVLQVDRDFNEDDYEMLLGLDENNHHHAGASVHLINRLPQSTVQNDNVDDCAICLETPTMGDSIRHLPCLHKFHKDCIDPWLRRNTSCPVCKSSVT